MASAAGPQEFLLRVEHLGRTVAGKVILEDVSFSLCAGEILGIQGPSGSGKSSLLRLLNRLDEPSTGAVFLEGKDYRELLPRELRRRVALVMQRPYLFAGIVEDNIRFGPKQRNVNMTSQEISDLLTELGLSGYADRDVAKLSGGEAQRVSLARALANSPSVLLLDEPTSALDEASKSGIETLIQMVVRQKNLGCVLVSHDLAQISRMTDKVLHLEHGKVVPEARSC